MRKNIIIPNIPRPEPAPPTPSTPILIIIEPAIMQTPTLRASQSFDPKADCEKLHKVKMLLSNT